MTALHKNATLNLYFSRNSMNWMAIRKPVMAKNDCSALAPFIIIMWVAAKYFYKYVNAQTHTYNTFIHNYYAIISDSVVLSFIHTVSMNSGLRCGTILLANAQCAHITPNMQSVRKQLIDRKSLETSEPCDSFVNLYQFLGNENASSAFVTI